MGGKQTESSLSELPGRTKIRAMLLMRFRALKLDQKYF